MVCLVSLLLLAINTSDLISNIMIGDFSGTTFIFLFRNSLFSILECSRDITEVHDALYSL